MKIRTARKIIEGLKRNNGQRVIYTTSHHNFPKAKDVLIRYLRRFNNKKERYGLNSL